MDDHIANIPSGGGDSKIISLDYIGGYCPYSLQNGTACCQSYLTWWTYKNLTNSFSLSRVNQTINTYRTTLDTPSFYKISTNSGGSTSMTGIFYYNDMSAILKYNSGTLPAYSAFYPILFTKGKPFMKLLVPAEDGSHTSRWYCNIFLNSKYFNLSSFVPRLTDTDTTTVEYPITINKIGHSSDPFINNPSSSNYSFTWSSGNNYYYSNTGGQSDSYTDLTVGFEGSVGGNAPQGASFNLQHIKEDNYVVLKAVNGDIIMAINGYNGSTTTLPYTCTFNLASEFFDFSTLLPDLYS